MEEVKLKEPSTPKEEVREPIVETIAREESVKKCCQLSSQTRTVCHCCVRSWSLCLNGLEGGCSILSNCCILFSNMAIGCNKCLEQMDCDGH